MLCIFCEEEEVFLNELNIIDLFLQSIAADYSSFNACTRQRMRLNNEENVI